MATVTTPQPSQNGTSHPFTCNTCQVAFRGSELQRTHMQSDWHRYNLKRRVASLPPLTSDIFAEKVLANKATAAATAAKASFEKRCEACEKSFYSEGAFRNHVGSQKHRLLAAQYNVKNGHETDSLVDSTFSLGEPMENASTTTGSTVNGGANDEEEFDGVVDGIKKTGLDDNSDSAPPSKPTPANHLKDQIMSGTEGPDDEYEHKADTKQCLFCNYISPTIDLNVHHMGRQHGFFVPEREYLVDLNGLINYLSETIQVLHTCLYCHKSVHTSSGVQTHMRDRGHCMIAYSTEEEQMDIGEFYDFRSTYSDNEDDSETEAEEGNGGVSLGVKRPTKTTVQNAAGEDISSDSDEEDAGWESDDSSASSVPTDEITSVPVDAQKKKPDRSRHGAHPHKNADGFHSHAHQTPHAAYHDDYELHLPSGRTAGHRSLRTYYRQNLRNYPTPEEREQQRLIDAERHDSDADDEENEGGEVAANGGERGRGRQGGQMVTRAEGGLGMMGVSEEKRQEVKKVEKRERRRQERQEKRYQWGNEKRGNHQKHYRDHLLQ